MLRRKNKESRNLRNDVYQSNLLIQSQKNFDMIETRIFLLGLRGLNPHLSSRDKYFDAEFKEMFIPTKKLTELLGGNTWYLHNLQQTCAKMFDTKIKINMDDSKPKLCHVFRRLNYVPKEGLYIWFDDVLRSHLLDLHKSKGYTRINVENLLKLSSPYAVRILEMLLQYQNIKHFKEMLEIKRVFTVEELRFALNVPEGTYSGRMNNFKKYVIEGPLKEINRRTPYSVLYSTIKSGRKVIAFEFLVDTSRVSNEKETPERENDAINLLCSLGFTEKSARAIFSKCYDVPDCFSRINRAEGLLSRQKRRVKNKLGFIRMAIEQNWRVGNNPIQVQIRGTEREIEPPMDPQRRREEYLSKPMTPIQDIIKGLLKEVDERTEGRYSAAFEQLLEAMPKEEVDKFKKAAYALASPTPPTPTKSYSEMSAAELLIEKIRMTKKRIAETEAELAKAEKTESYNQGIIFVAGKKFSRIQAGNIMEAVLSDRMNAGNYDFLKDWLDYSEFTLEDLIKTCVKEHILDEDKVELVRSRCNKYGVF